jgi:outer membrane protein
MFSTSKHKKWMLILFGGLLLGSSSWAQSPMSLKECIDYGLKHHGMQVIAANEIATADQKVREGLAGYLPQVNGNVSFDDNLVRPTTIIPAGTFSPEEIRVQFGNQYVTNGAVQLDQVIYDRGMLLGLKILDPYGDIAVITKEKNEQMLMYGAAMSYYQVQIYMEQKRLIAENIGKFDKMAAVVKLQVDKGVARKMDYDRVAVTLANLHAQEEVMTNEIEMAYNRLKNAIGMPLDTPLQVVDGGWDQNDALSTHASAEGGAGKVLDLKIQEKGISIQEIQLRRSQAMYLPTLGLYARTGAQAFGNDFGTAFSKWYGYASIGLSLKIPIWNSFRTPAQVKQNELALLTARENLKLSKANIEMQQQNAEAQWYSAQASIDGVRKNMELAKDLLDVTQLQMTQGVATLSDYLTADYAYKEAQTNYITALLRVITARLEFEKAQGTLPSFLLQQ